MTQMNNNEESYEQQGPKTNVMEGSSKNVQKTKLMVHT